MLLRRIRGVNDDDDVVVPPADTPDKLQAVLPGEWVFYSGKVVDYLDSLQKEKIYTITYKLHKNGNATFETTTHSGTKSINGNWHVKNGVLTINNFEGTTEQSFSVTYDEAGSLSLKTKDGVTVLRNKTVGLDNFENYINEHSTWYKAYNQVRPNSEYHKIVLETLNFYKGSGRFTHTYTGSFGMPQFVFYDYKMKNNVLQLAQDNVAGSIKYSAYTVVVLNDKYVGLKPTKGDIVYYSYSKDYITIVPEY